MSEVLIFGAAGKIAQHAIHRFLQQEGSDLTLYRRRSERLGNLAGGRVKLVEGDVTDTRHLQQVTQGQDVVYANLAGDDIEDQAKSTIAALEAVGVRRLIWISTLRHLR